MLVDWLAVEMLACFEKTFQVQHSLPHNQLLFYEVNGQFVVRLVPVTVATEEIARPGHSPNDNPRTPQTTGPAQEINRPDTATTR